MHALIRSENASVGMRYGLTVAAYPIWRQPHVVLDAGTVLDRSDFHVLAFTRCLLLLDLRPNFGIAEGLLMFLLRVVTSGSHELFLVVSHQILTAGFTGMLHGTHFESPPRTLVGRRRRKKRIGEFAGVPDWNQDGWFPGPL